jgi:hypothetical protein
MRILIIISICISTFIFANTQTFLKINDEGVFPTKWESKTKNDTIYIKGEDKEGFTEIETSTLYTLKKIKFNSKITTDEYVLCRDNNLLIAAGNINNKVIYKEYNIGNTAWFQEFYFDFKPFISSSEMTKKFYVINPKDFSLNKLIAKKEAQETITIKNNKYSAIKVMITLPGIKGMFWKGYIWFDNESCEFLKLRLNEGPKTPYTTIIIDPKD